MKKISFIITIALLSLLPIKASVACDFEETMPKLTATAHMTIKKAGECKTDLMFGSNRGKCQIYIEHTENTQQVLDNGSWCIENYPNEFEDWSQFDHGYSAIKARNLLQKASRLTKEVNAMLEMQ